MKLAILYFSKTGKTRQMAEEIAAGMRTVDGIEVRLFDGEEVDYAYLDECDALVFGTPTYCAGDCWQMEKWFQTDSRGHNLGGKLGAAFSTADYAQGGADIAIQAMVNRMLVKGMLVYSGGASLGQPFIHLGAVALKETIEASKPLFHTFGERIARKTAELFGQ